MQSSTSGPFRVEVCSVVMVWAEIPAARVDCSNLKLTNREDATVEEVYSHSTFTPLGEIRMLCDHHFPKKYSFGRTS